MRKRNKLLKTCRYQKGGGKFAGRGEFVNEAQEWSLPDGQITKAAANELTAAAEGKKSVILKAGGETHLAELLRSDQRESGESTREQRVPEDSGGTAAPECGRNSLRRRGN